MVGPSGPSPLFGVVNRKPWAVAAGRAATSSIGGTRSGRDRKTWRGPGGPGWPAATDDGDGCGDSDAAAMSTGDEDGTTAVGVSSDASATPRRPKPAAIPTPPTARTPADRRTLRRETGR